MGRYFEFPKSFLWGAATAAHQVEGNNRWNDWWAHEQNGALPFQSGIACNHYERYREDFDLAKSWGHNAHRLSVEWSRIEPEQGAWNRAAMEHYADVVAALRERDMEPVVTLHHFTNPAWFSRAGGWLGRDSTRLFARFVSHVAKHLPGVRYWLTINEPTVYVKNGYGTGRWPPFHAQAWLEAGRVMHRLARAHVAAYERLHDARDDVEVGFAHSAPFIVPCGRGGRGDTLAARARDFVLNDAFFWLVRACGATIRNSRPFDFIGINYYTRTIVRGASSGLGRLFGTECREDHHGDLGADNELEWPVYAPGLFEIAKKFAVFGVPILITENGIATADDDRRSAFIREHLVELAKAIRSGIDVRGYLHWTLMDNYEWTHGTQAHFGLAGVDPETGERKPRPSSRVFARICEINGVEERTGAG